MKEQITDLIATLAKSIESIDKELGKEVLKEGEERLLGRQRQLTSFLIGVLNERLATLI